MSTGTLVTPYQQLRKATLDRDRGLREKVMSLEAAARLVSDGDHVGIGGAHVGAHRDQLVGDAECRRLAIVAGVPLVGEAE